MIKYKQVSIRVFSSHVSCFAKFYYFHIQFILTGNKYLPVNEVPRSNPAYHLARHDFRILI